MPRKKGKLEFRYYEVPHGEPLLALLGEAWVRPYGYDEKNHRIKDLHFHNLLEVGYCYDGDGEVILENESYRYGSGTVTVIPNNYPHTTNSESMTSRWEYLFIDLDRTAELLYPDDQRYRAAMVDRIRRQAVCTDIAHRPELGSLIRMILREMERRQDFYTEAVYGLLRVLFAEIARCTAEKSGENQSARHHKPEQLQIARALEYVGNHYDDAMKVSDLAAACHLSETHFRRLFVKCIGMHPVDYINQVRVRMACEYMKKSNMPVSDIAEKCGFCSLATFNRNFRKYTGATPKEWKKSPEAYESRLATKRIEIYEGW